MENFEDNEEMDSTIISVNFICNICGKKLEKEMLFCADCFKLFEFMMPPPIMHEGPIIMHWQ